MLFCYVTQHDLKLLNQNNNFNTTQRKLTSNVLHKLFGLFKINWDGNGDDGNGK